MSVLNEPVLVLNSGWAPVETCTVRKAFEKVFGEKAKIVNTDDCSVHDFMSWAELDVRVGHHAIRTSHMNIRAPEVIVLKSDAKIGRKRDIIAFSRRNLMKRDSGTCQYCGKQASSEKMTIDHIMPKTRGGKSQWMNCVMSCFACNSLKANKTPDEAGMRLRSKPFEPRWSPIFRIAINRYKQSWQNFLPEKLLNR